MIDNKELPEWLQAYYKELARETHEDQARFICALDAAFVEVKRFYEQTKLPKE